MQFTPENTSHIFRAIDSFCELRYAFIVKHIGERAVLQHNNARTIRPHETSKAGERYDQAMGAFMISAMELFGTVAGGYSLDMVSITQLALRRGNRFDEHGASYLTAQLHPAGMELQKHFARYATETARVDDITAADAETMLASATRLLDVVPALKQQSAI